MKITLEVPDDLGRLDALFLCHVLVMEDRHKLENSIANSTIPFPSDGDYFRLGRTEESESVPIEERGTLGGLKYSWEKLANTKDGEWTSVIFDPDENGWYLTTMNGDIFGQEDPFVSSTEYEDGKWSPDGDAVLSWMPYPAPDPRFMPRKPNRIRPHKRSHDEPV